MNENIVALQIIVQSLQTNDGIKTLTTLPNGDGYTITFLSGKTITIYNGKDGKNGLDGTNGKDGKDGVNGNTPEISVKKDTDGIYYWTVNGEWLIADGAKVRAAADNGKDGKDGVDGANGITPQFKIEDGNLYIQYGNQNWELLGNVTTYNNCTCGIISINYDSNFVYVRLSDGSTIRIIRANTEGESKYIKFECPYVKEICLRNWDTDYDGELSYEEAAAVTSLNGEFSKIKYLTMTSSSVTWNSEIIYLGNHSILSFEELKYFTSLTEIQGYDFSYDINLAKISFPESLTKINTGGSIVIKDATPNRGWGTQTIQYNAFTDCPLRIVTLLSKVPIGTTPFFPVNSYCRIYVPLDALESYKTAWAGYAEQIYATE